MILLIGIWGSRNRKIFASYYFFFYTLVGSLLMLLAIMYIFYSKGTTDLIALMNYTEFNAFEQKILFIGFFMSFASKIPLFPFHIWLPEAHVEAPTAGSVLLAGVLLKLGSYGYLRFCCTLFPYANHYYKEVIAMLALIGIVNTSLTAIRQTDMKRVVAYASVAHMNLIMLGVFFFSVEGVEGAILQMISHGLVSSGLFLCIGVLYDRFHSKVIEYYGGVAAVMPNFVLAFGVLIFANIAFPGTSSFVGELLILAGIFLNNSIVALIGGLGVILGGTYSLYLFNRAAFGNFKSTYLHLYEDLTLIEGIILFILVFLVILIGVFPSILLDDLHKSVYELEIIYNLGKINGSM
jgi:proton-translocating NADH-quinone oxidoreductase chain M